MHRVRSASLSFELCFFRSAFPREYTSSGLAEWYVLIYRETNPRYFKEQEVTLYIEKPHQSQVLDDVFCLWFFPSKHGLAGLYNVVSHLSMRLHELYYYK